MRVVYWIYSGTPCEPQPTGIAVNSLAEAKADFKDYIEECDRFGNTWENAYMDVNSDYFSERLFEVGKRKGIKELKQ